MSRAMLLFERQADASWLPTSVILATPKGLQGKALPGGPQPGPPPYEHPAGRRPGRS